MIRAVFDSNAYDAVLRHDDAALITAALDDGRLALFASPVVQNELRQIADGTRRQRLLELYHRLHSATLPLPAPSLLSRDEQVLAQAKAERALLVSDDKALEATRYAAFRALLQA